MGTTTILACAMVAMGLAAVAVAQRGNGIEGSGRMATERRTVTNFTGVHHAGIGEVTIRAGERLGVVVEADDNVLPLIATEVKDGTLTIRTTQPIRRAKVRVTVTAPNVEQVRLSGAGNIEGHGIRARGLVVDLAGAGNVRLRGQVERLQTTLSGAGNLSLRELRSQQAEVRLSGAGNAELDVVQTLQATITGAGNVRYTGNPQVTSKVSGAGNVGRLR
jgi:hypothetical protein